jgi:hypothetical protein
MEWLGRQKKVQSDGTHVRSNFLMAYMELQTFIMTYMEKTQGKIQVLAVIQQF